MSDKKTTPILPLDQDLPPHLLANLITSCKAHSKQVVAKQRELGPYPDPATVTEFDDGDDLPEITFPGRSSVVGKGDADSLRKGKRKRRGGGSSGKSGGGGGGGGRTLLDPKMVHAEVAQMLQGLPLAGNTGNVQVGEMNCEFMDTSKATYFKDSYQEVVSRFHVVFLSEVDAGGVAQLAKVAGYQAFCSYANTRSQAVGFVVHPRLKVLGAPIEYSSIANVQGIPDLRPAFRLDLEDTVSGERFSVVALHLKSMRGGPAVTAVVRCKQFALLVQDLGNSFVGFVGGDLNYKIDDPNCREADPMINAGYALVAPGDHAATQIMGSRIDGFFTRGLKSKVDFYRVFAFFTNPKLKRSFTDHAALKVELLTASSKSNQSATQATSAPSGNFGLTGVATPVIVRHALQPGAAKSAKSGKAKSVKSGKATSVKSGKAKSVKSGKAKSVKSGKAKSAK